MHAAVSSTRCRLCLLSTCVFSAAGHGSSCQLIVCHPLAPAAWPIWVYKIFAYKTTVL